MPKRDPTLETFGRNLARLRAEMISPKINSPKRRISTAPTSAGLSAAFATRARSSPPTPKSRQHPGIKIGLEDTRRDHLWNYLQNYGAKRRTANNGFRFSLS